jgi:hypothetical protein
MEESLILLRDDEWTRWLRKSATTLIPKCPDFRLGGLNRRHPQMAMGSYPTTTVLQ